jgi:uncharacterized protein
VYAPSRPVDVTVEVTNAGAGIVATGTVTAVVDATCARCLCQFPLTIAADIEGFYVEPGHDIDLPEEQEVEFVTREGRIDLAPALHAALVLEAPFAPIHEDECAGICPTCGIDLNTGTCSCEHSADALHPLAGLKDFAWNEGEKPAGTSEEPTEETAPESE